MVGSFEVGTIRKCEFIIMKCLSIEENRISVSVYLSRNKSAFIIMAYIYYDVSKC